MSRQAAQMVRAFDVDDFYRAVKGRLENGWDMHTPTFSVGDELVVWMVEYPSFTDYVLARSESLTGLNVRIGDYAREGYDTIFQLVQHGDELLYWMAKDNLAGFTAEAVNMTQADLDLSMVLNAVPLLDFRAALPGGLR